MFLRGNAANQRGCAWTLFSSITVSIVFCSNIWAHKLSSLLLGGSIVLKVSVTGKYLRFKGQIYTTAWDDFTLQEYKAASVKVNIHLKMVIKSLIQNTHITLRHAAFLSLRPTVLPYCVRMHLLVHELPVPSPLSPVPCPLQLPDMALKVRLKPLDVH